jgi:nicotinate-nucleotide pyrophosphorylase (carboxylating)
MRVRAMDVEYFVKEDIESADITSEALLTEERAKGQIIAKENCILAGLGEACEVFKYFNLDFESDKNDGDRISEGDVILTIQGRARDMLAGERLALNFLARMSGCATETRKLVDICHKINPFVKVAATRKTTPGFREYEKKAVVLGGGHPHRMRLDDAFLIKDNHLKLVPSIEEAIIKAKKSKFAQDGKKVEIEVENLEDAQKAAIAGADIIMLDNMTPDEAAKSYEMIKGIKSDTIVEISGGITPENISDYAKYADMISLGYLTHSISAIDFSLEIAGSLQ